MQGACRAILLTIVMALLAACGDRFPDYSFKMAVYIDGKAYTSVRAVEEWEERSH